MSQYCDNRSQCRRKLLLGYFGQQSDKCNADSSNIKCDNCVAIGTKKVQVNDITKTAIQICSCVRIITNLVNETSRNVTLFQLKQFLYGEKDTLWETRNYYTFLNYFKTLSDTMKENYQQNIEFNSICC